MSEPSVRLIDVYVRADAERILFNLLKERDQDVSISHKKLPSYEAHKWFVRTRPYAHWYLVMHEIGIDHGQVAGAVYLTCNDEIGIHVFRAYQGQGIGPAAIGALMAQHPRERYLANINPKNARSLEMFAKLDFKVLQVTMSKGVADA